MPEIAFSFAVAFLPAPHHAALQLNGVFVSLIQISLISMSIYGLWYRHSGQFAAHCARLALPNSARVKLLADDSAQPPGAAPSRPSPIAPEGVPGRLGHRDLSRWPRQEGVTDGC